MGNKIAHSLFYKFLQKIISENFAVSKISPTFASQKQKRGRLAQLVQSICLTSRGSAVRIRQRPQ